MEKKHALILAFLITLIFAINFFVFSGLSERENYREKAVLERAIDGDTVVLDNGVKVRLININAPETGKFWSLEALNFLKNYENESIEIEIFGTDRYGRTLGIIYYNDRDINLELVNEGFAHTYLTREEHLKKYLDAQENAEKNEKGIWKKSEDKECLNAEINKKQEFLLIEDKCGLNFNGWSIKDEGWRSYEFGEFAASKFRVYSGDGKDDGNNIYWNHEKKKIWNNERNSLFIRDNEGYLAYYNSYGY